MGFQAYLRTFGVFHTHRLFQKSFLGTRVPFIVQYFKSRCWLLILWFWFCWDNWSSFVNWRCARDECKQRQTSGERTKTRHLSWLHDLLWLLLRKALPAPSLICWLRNTDLSTSPLWLPSLASLLASTSILQDRSESSRTRIFGQGFAKLQFAHSRERKR